MMPHSDALSARWRGMNHARGPRPSEIARALEIIYAVTGVCPEDVLGPRAFRPLVRARWLFVLAFRQWNRAGWPYSSLPAIARALNKRDHTTICHAQTEATALLETDAKFAKQWAEFQAAWEARTTDGRGVA